MMDSYAQTLAEMWLTARSAASFSQYSSMPLPVTPANITGQCNSKNHISHYHYHHPHQCQRQELKFRGCSPPRSLGMELPQRCPGAKSLVGVRDQYPQKQGFRVEPPKAEWFVLMWGSNCFDFERLL